MTTTTGGTTDWRPARSICRAGLAVRCATIACSSSSSTWHAGMYHYRYLARATTFGTFVVPPTKAEEMYVPEVFGRSGAITVEVKAP